MSQARPAKKSECLEIRLPYAAKDAFMEHCRQEGRSASESLRAYIDSQIEPPPPQPAVALPRRKGRLALILGAVAACGLAGAALPSLAHPGTASREMLNAAPDSALRNSLLRAQFNRLDDNHDGRIDFTEFTRRR
jgi:hypothetical protein